MLAAIRAFAKSWVAAILIGLLIVSFAVFGIGDVFRAAPRDAVIVAGDRTTGSADFKREFDAMRRNAEQQSGQPVTNETITENRLDSRLLEDLATREAFFEMLRRMGVRLSDKLTIAELRKIPAFFDQVSGRFDEKLYQQKLAEVGYTPARFEQVVRDDVAQSHFAAALGNGLIVPRAYTALAAIYALESRDLGFFSVPMSSVPMPAPPTDAQLTAFMNENKAQLTRPEFRVLTVVRFSPQLIAGSIPIDEAELKKRYDFRKDTLSSPETRTLVQIPAKDQAGAAQIAQRLARGEDPSAIAKSAGVDAIGYADKPKTAIPDKRVAEAAFALPAGEVRVVRGDLGLAVVKVDKITPGKSVTLEEARPALEAEVRKDAAGEKVYELTQAYEDAHTAGANLTEAAAKAGAPAVTLPPLSREGRPLAGQPLGLPPKLLESAFSLPAGGESGVEELGGGEYFAVRVEKILPPAMPSLTELKPLLTRVWVEREVAKRVQARGDALAERLRKGETLEAVAASAGARVTRAVGLDRANAQNNTDLSREGLTKAFGAKAGEVFTAVDTQPGLIVAKVEGVRPGGGPNLARMAEDARPQMSMTLFRELGESARRSAREQLKVKVNLDAARAAIGLEPVADEKGKAGKNP